MNNLAMIAVTCYISIFKYKVMPNQAGHIGQFSIPENIGQYPFQRLQNFSLQDTLCSMSTKD